MTISKELFLAILSMDAYNREDGAGVLVSGNQIGAAIVQYHDQVGISLTEYNAWQAAGFYAIAYTVGSGVDGLTAGSTVISYRGTDNPDYFGLEEGGSDFWNGWLSGAGVVSPSTYGPGSQSQLALDFYEAVTNVSAFESNGSEAILTGHSLGGGLAGIVASLSGNEAVIFDNMPYGLAATALGMGWNAIQLGTDVATLFANGEPGNYVWPSAANITSYNVDGEVLSYVRALEPLASVLLGPLGTFAAANAIVMSA